MGVCEIDALFGKLIESRRRNLGEWIVAREISESEIIGEDDHNVGSLALGFKRECGDEAAKEE